MEETEVKEKGNPYLMKFIESKGGAKKVQHMVSLGYQALVQLEQGSRFGRPSTFAKFAEAFKDFDIVHASTGKPSTQVMTKGLSSDDLAPDGRTWKEYGMDYQRQFEDLRTEHQNVLTRILKKERPDLFTDQEDGSKRLSGNYVTDYNPIGFRQFGTQLTIKGTNYTRADRPMITPDITKGWPMRYHKRN